jgi:hypothetical protein
MMGYIQHPNKVTGHHRHEFRDFKSSRDRCFLSRHLFAGFVLLLLSLFSHAAEPISLHPENPHYFLFRGKPAVLVTSAEHYGALLNLDFDYRKYFDTLHADGLNYTRIFSGAYVEPEGAFNISRNTLAPPEHRFICPWPRSDVPGYAKGGNKFDLSRWDPAYFDRLKDLVRYAGRRGVVVEFTFFCPFYEEKQWQLSPQNAVNNINGIGNVARTNVYTLDQHGGLLAVHEALVRKVVEELNEFDNLFYEIANEPYFGGITLEWQRRIADVIVDAQKNLPNKHLIAQNIANGRAKIENPHPAVSLFNFHYASPPDTVEINYHLNKAIGNDETGFVGTNDMPYRIEGWDFILAGGALYNNLDYSFAAGYEDGTFQYPAQQPGGGNPGFRRQMKLLNEFIHSFEFIRMKPDNSIMRGGVPAGLSARALVEPGKAYAIYICRSLQRANVYSAVWTGNIEPRFSEDYTFHTLSNDGVRLWIDGRKVLENWTNHSVTEDSGTIPLEAGRKYNVKLEYYQDEGNAVMKLFWSSPSQKREIVPQSQLHLPDGAGKGLRGEYYIGKNFDHLEMVRRDGTINFDWSNRSPFSRAHLDTSAEREVELKLAIPAGTYKVQWLDPLSGNIGEPGILTHSGGEAALPSPVFKEDLALSIRRTKP